MATIRAKLTLLTLLTLLSFPTFALCAMHSQSSSPQTVPPRPKNRILSRDRIQGRILRTLAIVLACGALAGIGWWQYQLRNPGTDAAAPGAGRKFGPGNARQPVSVKAAQKQDLRITATAIGSLAASNMAVVHVQVSGVLQRILFHEGQTVREGALLAEIDPRAFAAQVGQAEGTLARDQAQLDNARVDLQRYQDLLRKDAIPRQQLDTQQALVRQLEGSVATDRSALESARLQLSYTRVTAPLSGRVGLKQADLGNVVQPGDANGVVSIAQTRPMAMVFAVPASLLPQIVARLHAHQPLKVLALDKAGGNEVARGQVASIDNAIDASTDTIKVKALFPNRDDTLFPNQTVSVVLELDVQKDVLTVPQAAVLRGAQGFYVYVVGEDGAVSTRSVVPGAVDGAAMAVTGAVEVGDIVVVDGVDRLRNGAKVEIIKPDDGKSGKGDKGGGGGKRWKGGKAGDAETAAKDGKGMPPGKPAGSP